MTRTLDQPTVKEKKNNYCKPKVYIYHLQDEQKDKIKQLHKDKIRKYDKEGVRLSIVYSLGLIEKENNHKPVQCKQMENIQSILFHLHKITRFTQRNHVRNVLRAYDLHPAAKATFDYVIPKDNVKNARKDFAISQFEIDKCFKTYKETKFKER